jgi:2-methylcitrate dehydratase
MARKHIRDLDNGLVRRRSRTSWPNHPKKSNAEIHSQSAIEGLLELLEEHDLTAEDIDSLHLAIFDVAYHIIGGGEEGDKTVVRTKEEADHSLPYLLAVCVFDGTVLPDQYRLERIERDDVQSLLRRVTVLPDSNYSEAFPGRMRCKITVSTVDGRKLVKEKDDYEGFHTRPMSWETVTDKFERLSASVVPTKIQAELLEVVEKLEDASVDDLTQLLAVVR